MSRKRKDVRMQYSVLPSTYDTPDGIDSIQFERPKPEFPLKSFAFILGLALVGGVCLITAALILLGFFDDKYGDRIWPLFMLGMVMFIPGGYYGWIALNIFFGKRYTLDDIPVF